MKYFSMFTGIGGFEIAVNSVLPNAELVGYSEIDKFANDVLAKQFEGVQNYGDATTIDTGELPDFDLLVGGFPCQAFSHAGKRRGFDETRGTLFFEVARIIRDKRPRYLVLENVKGLLTHKSGETFQTILGVLAELGYSIEWQLLNSQDFNVPQNRERVYIVGRLGGPSSREVFPLAGSGRKADSSNTEIRSVAQTVVASYYKGGKGSHVLVDASYPGREPRVYETVAPTVRDYGSGGNKMPMVLQRPRGKNAGNIHDKAPTLTGKSYQDNNHILIGKRVRRLMPIECERLQAFPDNWTSHGVINVISDTQRYKMAGNAITTNVAKAVIGKIFV